MTHRPEDLAKLKIDELKKLCPGIPKKIKKKTEIIAYILDQNTGDKRSKLAPIFSRCQRLTDCRLCGGGQTVWCELGQAKCPLCCTEIEMLAVPIKQEKGNPPNYEVDSDGMIRLHTENVNLSYLSDLVIDNGHGVCESIEALKQSKNDLSNAAEFLIEKTRRSAENYSLEQAQLNSEEVQQISKATEKQKSETSRNLVLSDVSEFIGIDANFSSKYIFPSTADSNGLVDWLVENDNALLVYDYLKIRKDAIKWYKDDASTFFIDLEETHLSTVPCEGFKSWFKQQIDILQDALYGLPASGGMIPSIFKSHHMSNDYDDEIQLMGVTESCDRSCDVLDID